MRILTVEDEREMADLIARGLRADGYVVDVAGDGVEAMAFASDGGYDIAILDVMLPGMSGFELCRWLRRQHSGLAIILLTARDAVDDRVRGLDAGADDYLTKPFEFVELAARLRALSRRDAIGSTRMHVGGLHIDMTRHQISTDSGELRLSRTEFDLLRLLASNVGRVMPRAEILDVIWGSAAYIDPNIVDQYISYVRRKLDTVDAHVRIVTARGVGFELIAMDP
ncbi:response regulator transcription factor [Microbacterium sp. SSW1-49]|uniref:Response regulator transcription factor n=1 Tax=Microbacterium croceum TaxID=2851645 RepID=A0ABT0FDE6_9MICO|nr:response regulator transcription factor [Microbacterium croceum]